VRPWGEHPFLGRLATPEFIGANAVSAEIEVSDALDVPLVEVDPEPARIVSLRQPSGEEVTKCGYPYLTRSDVRLALSPSVLVVRLRTMSFEL
jgi:hypothetical protein